MAERNHALEQEIRENPEHTTPLLALADWLGEQDRESESKRLRGMVALLNVIRQSGEIERLKTELKSLPGVTSSKARFRIEPEFMCFIVEYDYKIGTAKYANSDSIPYEHFLESPFSPAVVVRRITERFVRTARLAVAGTTINCRCWLGPMTTDFASVSLNAIQELGRQMAMQRERQVFDTLLAGITRQE